MSFKYDIMKSGALVQLLLGCLCFIFGILDRAKDKPMTFTAEVPFAVWSGVWFGITGALGIGASWRQGSAPRIGLIATFMGFSITSAIFASIMVMCYGFAIPEVINQTTCSRFHSDDILPDNIDSATKTECQTKLTLVSLIIILAVVECGVGIWSTICCCRIGKFCEPGQNSRMAPDPEQSEDQPVYFDFEEDLLLT